MPRRRLAAVAVACVALTGGVPQIHACHAGRIHVRRLPEAERRKRPQKAKKTSGDVSPANPGAANHPASRVTTGHQHAMGDASKNRGVVAAEEKVPVYLTRREAAEIARVHVNTIDRAIRQKKLRAGGSAGLIRIRPEWLYEWIDSREGRAK